MTKKIILGFILILCAMGIISCGTDYVVQPLPAVQPEVVADSSEADLGKADSSKADSSQALAAAPIEFKNVSSPKKAQAVPVLYYHSVLQETGNEVRMPPDQFEAQMAYLKEQGYNCISLDQLSQAFFRGGTLPAKPFAITFDDGYADNYLTAFPILKKYGFTATVFMVSSYIDGEGFLSWPQLKELAASGWEIEGHSLSHPYLSKLDHQTMVQEINASKNFLEKGLEHRVNFFAYPYGDYNPEIREALQDAGYLMAFTTEKGWADLKGDALLVQRVYCFADMGSKEFTRRMQNQDY